MWVGAMKIWPAALTPGPKAKGKCDFALGLGGRSRQAQASREEPDLCLAAPLCSIRQMLTDSE